MPLTLAHLFAAETEAARDAWLAGLPDDLARARVRLVLGRRAADVAELGSRVLARTRDLSTLAAWHDVWTRELDAGGRPWVQTLRAAPLPAGLVAELRGDDELSLVGLSVPRFASDEVALFVAPRYHPSVQDPAKRRRDRLRWAWARGEAALEPDAEADVAAVGFPRVEPGGWGPSFLVREPHGPRIELPRPEGGSASAHLTADGGSVVVYGSLDEYAGGFVWIVDARTLAIVRRLDTDAPVSEVHAAASAEHLLVVTFDGIVEWRGATSRKLPLAERTARISPDGRHAVTAGDALRVWSVADLIGDPPPPGFETRFSPDGARLVSGRTLFDGHTGRHVATLAPELGRYLEGGPASPSTYLGTRWLVLTDGSAQVWDTATGRATPARRVPCHPQWYSLAYDRAGERTAIAQHGERTVELRSIPEGRRLAKLSFDLEGQVLALDAEGEVVALAGDTGVEVRSVAGALIGRFARPPSPERTHLGHADLRFSRDGRRIACHRRDDGWRIWDLADGAEARAESLDLDADFADPYPRDWEITSGATTVFRHVPTGARISLPAAGPWHRNPADPRILASAELHVELRVP